MELKITLGLQFTQALKQLEHSLHRWTAEGRASLLKAHKQVADRWRSEAARRVPVDTSRLKQQILGNAYEDGLEIIAEVGTNVTAAKGAPYPVYLEFGTRYIARGRVLALGFGPYVTDADAIKFWPAKNAGIVDNETGKANMPVVRAIERRLQRHGADEQMPWLRPAFWRIRDWAVKHIDAAIEPPRQTGAAA